MNFSAWSIKNPVAPLLAFAMLLLVGLQSFFALPITRFPNIDVPIVMVSANQPGAAPAELEGQVAKVLEDAIAGVSGVKNITTNISDGNATLLVEFRMEVATIKAVQDTKDAVDRITGDLPADVEKPDVLQLDIEGQPILTYAVSSPAMTFQDLSWFVDDTIKRQLQGKPGIGRVDVAGGADREILIALDPIRLDAHGITASAVSSQLKITNTNVGGGRTEFGAGEQAIRTMGDTKDVARLAMTPIALPNGTNVRLSDLGTVTDTTHELRSFAMSGETPVVTFSVYRSKGSSEVSAAETAVAQIEAIQQAHPDVAITKVDDMVRFTYGNYEAALHTLLEGALLAVIVVFLFLRNWRATLISAVALPLSAIPTFWVMDLLGFSLNLVSFLSLTLATGILVDDAIVEIENIARHIRMGKSPYRAAMEAADEIGLAVIATTSTIIAVFVPVSFMPGIPGQYFRQFGITVAVAVFFSLIVARLITPMMAAYLMKSTDGGSDHDHADGPFMRAYLKVVSTTTKGRWYYATFAAAVASVVLSVILMATIPGSFLPPEDNGRVTVFAQLPPGSRLDDTRATTKRIYETLKDIPHVENILIMGGTSPTGELDVRNASITLILEPLDHSLLLKLSQVVNRIPLIGLIVPDVPNTGRPVPQAEISAEVFKRLAQIPDIRVRKLDDRGQPEFSYNLLADNEQDLNAAARIVTEALHQVNTLEDVIADGALPRPELQITPRAEEAARLGVTAQAIAATVRVATVGDFDAALPKVSLDERLIPIRVQLSHVSREDVARISNLRIQTKTGAMVPLSTVADVKLGEGPATVKRFNRQRLVLIAANLPLGVPLGTATEDFMKATQGLQLPGTARLVASGDSEVQAEMTASFGNAMLMGLVLMLSVLILLFGSVIQPFTILFSLLLSIGGVAVALIVTGSAISMPVLIGFLMLMGIVAKNAILLIDFAIEMRAKGMDRVKAVVEAGHKRAQPIVMTSIAMSAGMLPSALGVGEGGAFRAPMAIAVMGGIIVSTVLSLVVVPAFYLMMDDLSHLLGRIFGGLTSAKEPEPETPSPEVLAERMALLAADQADLRAKIGDPPRPRLAAE
jgi:multidrug efflux pump subunit AcrB